MEFKRRSAHPLESGNIRCTDCHDIAGIDDPLLAAGLNFDCQECHAEKSGPFIYEHPVVNNHTVDGRGCVACHEPHGSPNDRLLNQPGNLVCLQCHAVPVGHRLQHSALGAKLACIECHNQVHGSFDGSKFLDPDLGLKLFPDCFQSGCHSLND
jgi:DmsE family decaheme c-type cytochrome